MTDEQKQKIKDYQKEYYKRYYIEKKVSYKRVIYFLVIMKEYKWVILLLIHVRSSVVVRSKELVLCTLITCFSCIIK